MNNIIFRDKDDVNDKNINLLIKGKNILKETLMDSILELFDTYKQFSVRCSDGEILALIDLEDNLWVKDNFKKRKI